MARTNQFTGLAEFLSVARQASFRAAGADLGMDAQGRTPLGGRS